MSTFNDITSNVLGNDLLQQYGKYKIYVTIFATLLIAFIAFGVTYSFQTDEDEKNDNFSYVSGVIGLLLLGVAFYNFNLRNDNTFQQTQGQRGVNRAIFGSGQNRGIF